MKFLFIIFRRMDENFMYRLDAFTTRIRILSAARRIQHAWRFIFIHVRTTVLAAEFLDRSTGLSIDHVKSMRFFFFFIFHSFGKSVPNHHVFHSFQDLTNYLRSKHLIDLASKFLYRVHRLCFRRHRITCNEFNNISPRVFLSMFLIAYFQENVFESSSDVERSLANVSVFLSDNFERISRCLIETGSFSKVPVGLSIVFIPTLFKFFWCFKLWKVPDEAKLTKRIIGALIALEDAVVVQRRDDPDNTAQQACIPCNTPKYTAACSGRRRR